MRKNIAAANWKMNLSFADGMTLIDKLVDNPIPKGTYVVVATPYIHLKTAIEKVKDIPHFYIAAQNLHSEESGAYTGEVSAYILSSINCEYVLIGHSERRENQNDNGKIIRDKIDQALSHHMNVIYCCGESLDIRKEGKQFEFVIDQIETELIPYLADSLEYFTIAYEPIWAIGTGETATPEQAEEMHFAIREALRTRIGDDADKISILYGGSVKPSNAKEIFAQADVDGGLVGGASLKAESFIPIINAF